VATAAVVSASAAARAVRRRRCGGVRAGSDMRVIS
jgi:hypothetical protein